MNMTKKVLSHNKRLVPLILVFLLAAVIFYPGSVFLSKKDAANAVSQNVVVSNIQVIPYPNTPNSLSQYTINFTISESMNSDDYFVIQDFTVGAPVPQNSNFIGNVTVNGYSVNTTLIGSTASTGGYKLTLRIVLNQAIQVQPGSGNSVSVIMVFNSSIGIHNPSAGTYQLRMYAVKDSVQGSTVPSKSYSIGQGGVSNLTVSATPQLVGADARYTIGFKTSASGALTANSDTISIQFPTGTTLPASIAPSYITVNGVPCTSNIAIVQNSLTITLTVPLNISYNTNVTVIISELALIKNPSSAGNYEVILWTSKDTTHKTSTYYSITASSITKPTVAVSPSTVQSEAQYTISFRTSTSGALTANQDTIVITFPSSTYVPANINANYVKVNGTVCSTVSYGPGSFQVTVTTPVYVANNSNVTVIFLPGAGIKNPTATGNYTLKVHTSKDPADVESNSYSIGSSKVRNVSVVVTPNVAGTPATYIVQFTAGSAGALSSGDEIVITFPNGTILPASISKIYVTVNGVIPASVSSVNYSHTVTITLSSSLSILPSQTVVVTIDKNANIKNPSAGSYTLKLHTSKESEPVESSSYSITGLPKTTITVNPSAPDGKNGYYVTPPKVTLSTTGSSGLSVTIYYRIDSGDFTKYVSPFIVPDGEHTVFYYCEDSLGNKEAVKSKQFKVDTTLPTLEITSPHNGDTIYKNSVVISGAASKGSTVTINGQPVKLSTAGLFTSTVTLTGEGKNVFNIIAENIAGSKVVKTLTLIYVKRVTVILQVGNSYMYVNGTQKLMDSPPFILNGRTMVPLRVLSTLFGAEPQWDPIFQIVTIELNGKKIRIQVGNKIYDNNGKKATLDVPPVIKKGRTFVPLRLIVEGFGGEVTWDPKMQIINIVYPKP